MNPLLRWAGSKRKVLAELRSQSPSTFGRYFEPFAGSAVLFFDLMPNVAVLGDLNPEVVATYEAVRDTPDDVCRHLYSIPHTTDAYYSVRSLAPEQLNSAQRAARLIFLMKSCFNGVYRTNQQGKFNVPLGNKFFALPTHSEVTAASNALQQVDLVHGDFGEAVATAGEGDFVYLDPPYSDGTRFRGEYSYQGSFQASDQQRLVSICEDLTTRGVKVLLSFKECETLCNSLTGWSLTRITVNRSVAGFAHARRFANEILARNF
jgi:DNA adenine methylase